MYVNIFMIIWRFHGTFHEPTIIFILSVRMETFNFHMTVYIKNRPLFSSDFNYVVVAGGGGKWDRLSQLTLDLL